MWERINVVGNNTSSGAGVRRVDMDEQWWMYDKLPPDWRKAVRELPGDVDVGWAYWWWIEGRGLDEWRLEVMYTLIEYGFGDVERELGIRRLWI